MVRKIKNLRETLAVIFLIVWAVIMVCVVITLSGCSNPQTQFEKHVTTTTVDSVWVKKPGEINTLQFDPVYYAKTTDSGVISGRTEFHVGDTIKRIRYIKK
jgi:uncharacterized membrane protein